MRPVKLTLDGFTSFARSTTIDFRGMDLFAIVGQTGAGKTSLLDAMLYALFGRTPRLSVNSVEELMNLGARSMGVQFEFVSGGDSYVATRSRRQAGKKYISEFRLDRNGVTTSTPVDQVLGLDFDGFTRAVMLPQGKFDEFLRGDRQKRTDILKELLNLNIYSSMMSTAKTRADAIHREIESAQQQLMTLYKDATAEKLAEREQELASLNAAIAASRRESAELEATAGEALALRRERESKVERERALEDDRKRQRARQTESETLERRIAEGAARVEALRRDLASGSFDSKVWASLVQVRGIRRSVDSVNQEIARLRASLRGRTVVAVEKAQRDLREAQDRFGSPAQILRLAADLESARRDLECDDPAGERDRLKAAVEEAAQSFEALQRAHLAEDLRSSLKAGERCPVCEQVVSNLPAPLPHSALDDARKARERAKSAAEAFETGYTRWENLRKIAGAEPAELRGRAAAVEKLQSAFDEAQDVQKVDQAIRLKTADRDRENARLQEFPDFALLPLDEIEASLDDLDRRKAEQERVQEELNAAQTAYATALQEVAQVRGDLLALEKSIQSGIQDVSQQNARIVTAENSIRARLEGFQAAPGIDEYVFVDRKRKLLQLQIADDSKRSGLAEAAIAKLKDDIRAAEMLRESMGAKAERAAALKRLGVLLDAKHFVAYLQRRALQQLADLATVQLKELSEGRYMLTLGDDDDNEFYVHDAWNAGQKRSSKTLSGGESFLASLSLALALSEYSQSSSQVRLDSLFLDEGFSTLDSDSLRVAIEAIQALSAKRRMVGVISHLPELAAELPVRIQVDKSPAGSTVTIDRGEDYSHSMVAGGL